MSTRWVTATEIVDIAWRSWNRCCQQVAGMDERGEFVPPWLRLEPAARWQQFLRLLRDMENDRLGPFGSDDCPF